MNLIGYIGIFLLLGGVLFAAAAWSLSRGKRISVVEATVTAVNESEEEDTTEYAFPWEGTRLQVTTHTPTACRVGETEKMYFDSIAEALYHPRLIRAMWGAAAAFAVCGGAMLAFQAWLM